MSVTRCRRRDERGFTLVLFALVLVGLLIFTAFAVDLGAVYNERRQDQSAADVGSMGGIQSLTTSRVAAATEVARLTFEAVKPGSTTLTQWETRFKTDCTDPDDDSRGFTEGATGWGDCISFTPNNQRMRVRIPQINVKSSFARVIGIDGFETRAFAEVQADLNASGDVLPFGLTSSATTGEVCLKSGANPQISDYPYGACNGPTTGNFGRLNISLYGNFSVGTPQDCATTGNSDDRLAINTAMGVDHPLSLHPNGNPANPVTVEDDDNCFNFLAKPNTLESDTGNPNAGLNQGMYFDDAGVGEPGRLAQDSPYKATASREVRDGYPDIDNYPLWEFIPNGLGGSVPASCRHETFDNSVSNISLGLMGVTLDPPLIGQPPWRTGAYAAASPANESKAHLRVCFDDYIAGSYTSTLFGLDSDGDSTNREYDIQKSRRFGFTPQIWATTLGTGTTQVHIKKFPAVWIQSLWFGCNANGCTTTFDPGENGTGVPAANNTSADALTAFLFVGTMLPTEIIEDAPGTRTSTAFRMVR